MGAEGLAPCGSERLGSLETGLERPRTTRGALCPGSLPGCRLRPFPDNLEVVMLALLAGMFLGTLAGAITFGSPGAIMGASVGTMLTAIVMLNRE